MLGEESAQSFDLISLFLEILYQKNNQGEYNISVTHPKVISLDIIWKSTKICTPLYISVKSCVYQLKLLQRLAALSSLFGSSENRHPQKYPLKDCCIPAHTHKNIVSVDTTITYIS